MRFRVRSLGEGSSAAVAVVQVGSCSSNSTPSLGTSLCLHKKAKRKKKKKKIKVMKSKGDQGLCPQRELKRHGGRMQCGVLDRVLEQKRDVSENTCGEI